MWRSELSEKDIQALSRFRFGLVPGGLPFADLLKPDELPGILDRVIERTGALNRRAGASLLIKRMSFYAVIHLYAMTALKKKVCADMNSIQLVEKDPSSSLWLPDFYFGSFLVEAEGGIRENWRDGVLQHVFAETLYPLIALLQKQTRLSKKIMWENIAVYVSWIYDEMMKSREVPLETAAKDRHYIFYEAAGDLFGTCENNPLSSYANVDKARTTCCLSYMLNGKGKKKCANCPLAGCNRK